MPGKQLRRPQLANEAAWLLSRFWAAGGTPARLVWASRHVLAAACAALPALQVRADGLLAGELHAMCGYWMLSRLLPEVDAQHVLLGLRAMEGLGYKVGCGAAPLAGMRAPWGAPLERGMMRCRAAGAVACPPLGGEPLDHDRMTRRLRVQPPPPPLLGGPTMACMMT